MLGWIDLIFLPFTDLLISSTRVKQLATGKNILLCDTRLLCQKTHLIQGRSLNYGLSEIHVYSFGEKAMHNWEKKKKKRKLVVMLFS